MKLDSLTQFLRTRLNQEMPGSSAHNMMQPKMGGGAPIRIKHTMPPRPGGVLILFFEENGLVKFPLIQRPEYEGIHSGQIAFPGGKSEASDASLVETALREAEEEIGVDRNQISIVGALSDFFVAASNFDILPVVGVAQTPPNFKADAREVSEIITPQAKDLIHPETVKTKEMVVRNGITLASPYFDLEEKVVWGATAMMLSELKVILQEYAIR